MDSQEKKELSESDIRDLFITPAIKDAGWDQMRQIRREVTLTPGPIVVRGNMSSRNQKKKKKFADYVLSWERDVPIAEQHCVVANVDERMALCDAPKRRLRETQTTHPCMVDVAVAVDS